MSDSEEWDEAVEELEADLRESPLESPAIQREVASGTTVEGSSQGFYRRIGEYTSLAFVFPAAMLLGFFGGRWVGGWFGGPGIGSGIGLVVGSGAAFLALFQSLRRLERLGTADDAEAAAAKRRGR